MALTEKLYAKIPMWILASIGAMGKTHEDRAITELVDYAAEAFKLGYEQAFVDMRAKLAEARKAKA